LRGIRRDAESFAASPVLAQRQKWAGEASAAACEITKSFGRVYQIGSHQSSVAIDWLPPTPILGCTALTRGQALFHPTEGKVVHFPKAIRRRRGTTTIAMRTGIRPDLLELFDLAIEMQTKLGSEV
jgi:hypothetical protein